MPKPFRKPRRPIAKPDEDLSDLIWSELGIDPPDHLPEIPESRFGEAYFMNYYHVVMSDFDELTECVSTLR